MKFGDLVDAARQSLDVGRVHELQGALEDAQGIAEGVEAAVSLYVQALRSARDVLTVLSKDKRISGERRRMAKNALKEVRAVLLP